MKKVIVKNLAGVQTHGAELSDPTAWIAECVASNAWGLAERWVPHVDEGGSYDQADVLDEREIEIEPGAPFVPSVPAVYESGILIRDEIPAIPEKPAVMQKQVLLKAQYSIQITDFTDELEKQKTNEEALKYLADTDWLVIREIDSGVLCPADVKLKRQQARERIVK